MNKTAFKFNLGTFSKLLGLGTLTFAALCMNSAWALQSIDSFDGKTSFVKVPQKEITRLSIEGGRIRDVIYARDELDLQKDEVGGQIYFTPLTPKAVNLFVSTTSGKTHGFILQPADLPLEQIIVKEIEKGGEASSPGGSSQGAVISNSSTYGLAGKPKRQERGDVESQVKRMVYALARSESMPTCEMKLSRQTIALYQGTYFERQLRLVCPNHTAEAFSLTNKGREPLRLVEQHLHTKGVLAVSIEQLDLDPGTSTRVFVVREGGQR